MTVAEPAGPEDPREPFPHAGGSLGITPGGDALGGDAPDGQFPLVGIGASAGGVEAFTALVSALTTDAEMAYVVVSHLDPAHPSALSDILARATPLPVVEIADEQVIVPNTIYVMPPGRDVTVEGTRLMLQPRAAGALHRPIDLFFRSLAEARRHQSIGVVLSGTATDGTLGIRAIKGSGGITFAQDDSARQTSMPHSAIADGFVDFVLPAAQIGTELVRIGRSPRALQGTAAPQVDEDGHVAEMLRIVRRETGVDFTNYKAGTLRRRILRRMILKRTDHLPDYLQLLRTTPGEARALHDDLLIGVTSFFRDRDSFEALTRSAFRRVLEARRGDEPIRVWVLGCSTGEEAYSLAIALTEHAAAAGERVPLQIFASDVNAAGIEVARAGTYSADISQDVSPERLARFFMKIDARYRVIKSIRDACIFSRHNVLTDPPFSRIDLVSCRNLLMYLEPVLQRDVIGNLHYSLKPDGVLWLGTADSVSGHGDLFDHIDAEHKIFGRRPGSVSHPVLRTLSSRLRVAAGEPREARAAIDVLKESDRVLLHRFVPAGLVVSSSMEILQYRGNVGRYVSPAPGKPSLSLNQVLDRRLHVAVGAAIGKAKRDGVSVRVGAVPLASDDGSDERAVAVDVVPVGKGPDGFLIIFDEAPPTPHAGPGTASSEPPRIDDDQAPFMRMARELADTRAYLQTVVDDQQVAREDLEAAHEEAQSANEELQSINEELETSKEEIQSANEELTTLNEELHHRNADLQLTNSDLVNLLASTDLAVVFVGPALEIRRFTAAAGRLLKLRPGDVGRPFSDLRLTVGVDVHAQIADTLQTLESSEQRVQTVDGRWCLLRTRPYRTLDNQIDGVVIVLVDIDEIVRARLYAESIVATVRAPLLVLDEHLKVVTANEAFHAVFGTGARAVEGRPFFEIGGRKWDIPELRLLLERVLPQDHVVKDFPVSVNGDGGHQVWVLDAQRLQQANGHQPLILLSMEDVSERQHAEGLRQQRVSELAAADRSKNEFLAMLAHELRNPLAPIRTAAQMLGTPGVPPPAVANARVIIERQIGNMVRLIDDLLDVARITQGKLALQLAPLELTSLLGRALEVVDRHIQQRGQRLTVALGADAIYVLGDATRLEQAFGNLLNNASKFSYTGSEIVVRAHVAQREHGADVFIHVKDAGIGIDPSTLPYIFDLFKQGAESPHRASGLGVGLALVRRIIELHGGRITVSSPGPNQGSEFVVCLPMLASADGESAHSEAPRSTRGETHRILVVDDNVDAAESLTALLRVYGHDARMVHDGPAVLELVPSFKPSIVFLDIGMPGMDGYEVARRLRRMPEGQDALLIALTGYGRDEDRQKSREAGFDRHVTKPLDPNRLPSLLSRKAEGASGS